MAYRFHYFFTSYWRHTNVNGIIYQHIKISYEICHGPSRPLNLHHSSLTISLCSWLHKLSLCSKLQTLISGWHLVEQFWQSSKINVVSGRCDQGSSLCQLAEGTGRHWDLQGFSGTSVCTLIPPRVECKVSMKSKEPTGHHNYCKMYVTDTI